MLQGAGNQKCRKSKQRKHSSANQQEIQEVKHQFEKHRITSLDAGVGVEPTAPDHDSGMLPLHHPAELEKVLDCLEKEAAKSIGKASNHAVFEFVKGIERHGRPLFESVDSMVLLDLSALYRAVKSSIVCTGSRAAASAQSCL